MHPEFRRPPVGPRRSAWPYRFAELFFGTIAKATMVIAVLLLAVLEIFSGGAGGSLSDLPTTRRGWRNLLLVMLTILIVVALGIYFFAPKASHPHR
ncbi:hypothetical protein [Paraburkholderia sp. MM6662-R1]|uniref:hypothetical protein n=1 Tax=Paraburkholderia sp. MM6662-R1 TaxID=2991066 RepID=UPI003D210244